MLEILHFEFNDQEIDWFPTDPLDFEEWVTISVGEEQAGNYYQLQLCTNTSISRIDNKRNVFVIEEWVGLKNTIVDINEFIRKTLTENVKEDPYALLGKYWYWEYQNYR